MDRPGTEITRTNTAASARSFLSRPSFGLSRKGSADASEREPKGPLGLTTLHVPVSEQTTPVADLVFVHGLNGGSHSTWSRGNIPECFWPRQWLPEDEAFKDVRIHTFGYPSGVTRESIINVSDIARSLLAAVKDSPIINKGKPPPLIFIAHSMGGLVVKKAYIIGHREIEFKPVADRVSSIFFLATPHQGAAIAQTLSRLTAMIGARPFVEDLFPQSPLTQSLGEDFPRVSSDLQLFSFFETRPMTVGVNRTLIVDKASAVMNLPNERRTFLDADHRNVAMFSTPDDPSYVSVRNALATVISHTISEQDSLQDISILLKANMASLPCPASAQWPTREEIAAQILKRSAGCFLWASIICSELRLVTSEREITKVMESTPLNMDAVYHDILAKMESARFGKAAAKAFIAWTTYAFRPLSVSEIQTPVEMDINDKIDDVQRTISRCCGSLVFVDNNNKVQLVHLTAREFFTRKGAESEFILTKAEGHRRLAAVCLKFLLQNSQKSFLFQHLKFVHSNDEELLVMLSDFLGSNNLLRWIEFTATNGDLRTIYQAGKTINSILNRRAQHSPPVGLARKQGKYALLEKWGDDLIHLVTNFSGWLRRSPKAIHHLIPPFCPPDSAIRRQFTNPVRGLNVQGLSSRGWNDCLTTITYPDGMKLNALAAGPGYFAVGMLNMTGQVLVYDDTIFQEVYILHHREPVWGLVFAESGKYVASAGARTVRIWCLADGSELSSFKITSLCLSLAFVEEDAILRVATKQNRLIDWDVEANAFVHDDPVTWTADLPDTMQFRTPMLAELGMASHLLAVLYRGENIVFWDCIDNRVYDTYEKETGSIQVFGSRKLAEGSTTVRAAAFGHSLDVNLFAATYTDGDLVVYDIDRGEVVAVVEGANTMVLATSQDGRTLAGADSVGNFTLFEFETLRALYRVRFDTQILPTALCFTSDSLRFIEIRAGQCRVWEPTVLLRTDMQDDDHSDTVSVSTGPQEVDHQILTNAVPEICSIACCPESSVVFCGMEDGSVLAHDTSGPEPEQRLLFVQDSQCGIHLLHFDSQGSTLSCGDRSGRFTVRKLSRPNTPRQRRTWEVAPPMIDGRTPGQSSGVLRQILSSSRHQRLLVSTEKRDTLWPMPKQGEGLWICQLDCEGNNNGSRWLTRPGVKSDLLLLIGDTGVELKLYDWATLDLVRVVSLSAGQSPALDRFAALTHQQFFATYTKKPPKAQSSAPMSSSARQNGLALLWDFQSLENGTEPLLPQYNLGVLPTKVEHMLGVSGSRLVLYMADHWIASVEIQLPGALSGIVVDGSFVRHFFLPNDWIGSMVINNMIFGIGRGGEIFLALRSELAIIKRGLEVTEDSGTFNSRRLNTGFWGASGGRVPFRHRAASSQS
ncbi:hypothetical protein B0J18DRAFT_396697 [Chaetomium sp. MPI-SDFR-AT-0129]|nr:hypothetical protein B0J18DRAFT_396697 [Chaetomium sp. MPI-SDFR-AT-0129]